MKTEWQNPEAGEIFAKFLKDSNKWIDDLRRVVQADTPDGYKIFYTLVHNRPCPDHVYGWIREIYAAHAKGMPTLLRAHRGSTKTTSITQTLSAYRLGCHPEGASLLVQLGDDIAEDNTNAIAGMIEYNAGFKILFPNVEPDKTKGWGASGYEIKRTDIDYDTWKRTESKRKDPSFVGLGYKSRSVIGKHPSRDMIIDDIHDENNTASERELSGVISRVGSNLEPTLEPNHPMHIVVGTPWVENDLLALYEATGEFHVINSPVYTIAEEGQGVYDKDIDEWINILWPEGFSLETIQKIRRRGQKMDGGVQFARMFLLDTNAASNRVFTYMSYPSTEIDWRWPMVGGVDYAGTADVAINKSGRNDAFAMAYVAKLPGGGAVVVDGVHDRCTQAQAEIHVKSADNIIPNYLGAIVEGDGKGEDFYQVLYRNPGIKLIAMKKTRGRGKASRLERELQPWLAIGRVRISDAETPFLNALRHELNTYPNNTHDDCMDAVYWALRGMPDVLQMPSYEDELPSIRRREKKENPLLALGRA